MLYTVEGKTLGETSTKVQSVPFNGA